MDLDDIQRAKRVMEDTIRKAIVAFEEKAGLAVESVDVLRIGQTMDRRKGDLINVSTKVEV